MKKSIALMFILLACLVGCGNGTLEKENEELKKRNAELENLYFSEITKDIDFSGLEENGELSDAFDKALTESSKEGMALLVQFSGGMEDSEYQVYADNYNLAKENFENLFKAKNQALIEEAESKLQNFEEGSELYNNYKAFIEEQRDSITLVEDYMIIRTSYPKTSVMGFILGN